MSARDTAGRQNGDSRQTHLNTGTRSMVMAETGRLRSMGIKGGAAATTIDITVDGTSVLNKSDQASGVVGIGAFKKFSFGGGVVVNQGSVIQITSTQADALATIAFMAA